MHFRDFFLLLLNYSGKLLKILFGYVELFSSFHLIFGLSVILLGPFSSANRWAQCFADIVAFYQPDYILSHGLFIPVSFLVEENLHLLGENSCCNKLQNAWWLKCKRRLFLARKKPITDAPNWWATLLCRATQVSRLLHSVALLLSTHSFSVCCPVLAWSQEKEKEHGGWELIDTYEPTTSNHKQPEKCILAVGPGRQGYGDWLVGFAPEYGTVFSRVIHWTTSSTPSYTKMMGTKIVSIILMG